MKYGMILALVSFALLVPAAAAQEILLKGGSGGLLHAGNTEALVITALHVVERSNYPIVWKDKGLDVAVVRTSLPRQSTESLRLLDPGHSHGFSDMTLRSGRHGTQHVLQMPHSYSPVTETMIVHGSFMRGHSGSVVVNERGYLIGVMTAVRRGSELASVSMPDHVVLRRIVSRFHR